MLLDSEKYGKLFLHNIFHQNKQNVNISNNLQLWVEGGSLANFIGPFLFYHCGDRPKIKAGWALGPSEESAWPKQSLFRPIGAKRTCPSSNFSSDIAKSRSKARSSHYNPSSKYVKRKETRDILAKAATTTLNASQLLSWPH